MNKEVNGFIPWDENFFNFDSKQKKLKKKKAEKIPDVKPTEHDDLPCEYTSPEEAEEDGVVINLDKLPKTPSA